ncbi:hypothetical protein T484DRAFT_3632510 [Baffinella frigidus]|nr:hypothetical protein T484DRAFT_3632510 [Cryptophyta sp. CCMP2293]
MVDSHIGSLMNRIYIHGENTDVKQTRKRKLDDEVLSKMCIQPGACGARKYVDMSIAAGCQVSTLTLAKDAGMYGISESGAREITFTSLSETLRDIPVVHMMKHLLYRLCAIAIDGEKDLPADEQDANINVQSFLASYMIAFHPTSVFESTSCLERLLIHKASKMLQVVESMRHNILAKVSLLQQMKSARGLHTAIFEYMQTFREWKDIDVKKLLARMNHELEAVLLSEQQLHGHDTETSTLRKGLQSQQNRIISEAAYVAGKQGVKEMDKVRERVMGMPVKHPAPETTAKKCTEVGDNSVYSVLPKSMSHELLTHEILLDDSFQLDLNGRPANERVVYSKIREQLDIAFWRSLQDDLYLTPPLHVRCVNTIASMKTMIDDMKFPALTGSTYPLFNMEAVKDELMDDDHSSWPIVTWDRYIQVIRCLSDGVKDAQTGQLSHSPPKDATHANTTEAISAMKKTFGDTIQSLEVVYDNPGLQPKVFIQALQVLMHTLKRVCVTTVNTRISFISSVLKHQGPQYLLDATNKKLESKTMTLDVTSAYIADAVESEVASKHIDLQDLICNKPGTTAAYNSIVAVAVMSALFNANESTFPETLHLDHSRLCGTHNRVELYTVMGAALGIVNLCLRDKKITTAADIMQEIGECLLASTLENLDLKGRIIEMVEILSGHLSQQNTDYVGKCLSKNLVVGSTVFKLSSARMKTVIFRAFHGTEVDIFAGLAPCVLVVIKDELRKHVEVLRQVLRVTLVVYASHYNHIIKEKATEMQER